MTETRPAQPAAAPRTEAAGLALRWHRVVLAAFLIDLLVVGVRLIDPSLSEGWALVPEAALVPLGALSAAAFVLIELPAQNVLLAVVLIAALSFAADLLSVATTGPRNLIGSLTWWLPLVRVFAILNGRGVARFLLRRCTPEPGYGFWVLGVTVVLACGFELGLGASVQMPGVERGHVVGLQGWYGRPWPMIVGWGFAMLVITALVTPTLINKRPGGAETQSSGWPPLLAWCGASLLLVGAAAHNGFWPAAGLNAMLALVPAALAVFSRRQFHH